MIPLARCLLDAGVPGGAAEASIYPKRSQNHLINDAGLYSRARRLGVVVFATL